MKIQKYIKDKQNKYKVVIDDEEYIFYDDVIIKFNLLMKKEITESDLKNMCSLNEELKSYYDSIKYIKRRLRSEKEIVDYLEKMGVDKKVIEKTISKLKEVGMLNDDAYLVAYYKDQINLTNNGPKRILNNLLKLGIEENKIEEIINSTPEEVWANKIDKYIDKKIAVNHSASSNALKGKIVRDLVNLGYKKEDVLKIMNSKSIDDREALRREYEKAKRVLARKYEGNTLENKIKERLYRKGFSYLELKELDDEK